MLGASQWLNFYLLQFYHIILMSQIYAVWFDQALVVQQYIRCYLRMQLFDPLGKDLTTNERKLKEMENGCEMKQEIEWIKAKY